VIELGFEGIQRAVLMMWRAEIAQPGGDHRKAGPIHPIPDHHRQAAAGQGRRRLPLRQHADQRDACPRPRTWQLPRAPAQRRAGRRNRYRQDASRHCDRSRLHPRRRPWPVLQCRRSGQQARGRRPIRTARPSGRLPLPQGLRRPRRTWLPALCAIRRSVAVPFDQHPVNKRGG
jgi:hypothetical protein